MIRFQSTPPHGGRHSVSRWSTPCDIVSIHAPARGATGHVCHGPGHRDVSIHAPARGATTLAGFLFNRWMVSIHAPARGATRRDSEIRHPRSVSIHAPARGATVKDQVTGTQAEVSIHAPARGATDVQVPTTPAYRFNPRPRTGGDVAVLLTGLGIGKFQSTPPHGGRLCDPETSLSVR